MEHLLFAGYLVLFSWIITKVKFFTRSGLTAPQLIIIFLLKVMAGIFYGWIGIYYGNMAQMVDTWAFHYNGLSEFQTLIHDPKLFFADIFHSNYADKYGGFLGSDKSWWNDLDWKVLVKFLGVLDIFSFGNYYTNVIFYSFLTFFGPVAFYRVMQHHYSFNKVALLLFSFLIPSFLYWTSGIHKEGLIFNAIAFLVYCFYFGWGFKKVGWKKIAVTLFSLLTLLVMRNYLVIIIMPGLVAWYLSTKTFLKPHTVFIGVYLLFTLFFFTAPLITPQLNFPAAFADKQHQFLELQGNSAIPVTVLKPTFKSFVFNAPQAFNHAFIRPYPSDINHLLSLAACLEINLLLLLFFVFLFWHRRLLPQSPVILFCIFFSLSVLMTIGYTVNFLGAIVRYRSIIFPLVFVPIAAQIKWEQLGRLFLNINK